jgi:hypothetical protein
MKGAWSTNRNAALLSKAMRDSRAGLLSPHQAGFDGAASTRGGLGAECCAMIGRYSNGMIFSLRAETTTRLGGANQAPPSRVNCQSYYGKQLPSWPTSAVIIESSSSA